jgi:two-component system sensor histidine kinase QseC
MKSIRRFLVVRQLLAFGLLFGGGAFVLYWVVRAALLAEFDAALQSKAATIRAFTKQTAEGLEWENPVELPTGFSLPAGTDFFQIRLPQGETFRRSTSLGTQNLPAVPALSDRPLFRNLTLPNGQPGRMLTLRYTPFVDKGEHRPAHVRERHPRPDFTPVQADLTVASSRVQLDRSLNFVLGAVTTIGAVFLVGAVLIIGLSLQRGLAPLNRLAAQAEQIDAASLHTRFPTDALPAELRPISQRLNDLLDRLAAAFERERQFSSDIAHELRTPIGELRTLAEVALQWGRDSDPDPSRETLAIARQMEGIVNRLFDLARCEQGKLDVRSEPVALAALAQEVWQPLAAGALQKRLTVRFAIPPELRVHTDPVLLRAILGNLLSNAAEYTPPEGMVSVELGPAGSRWALQVKNTPCPLTPDDVPHLFERFWRKDPARSSSEHCGLGLAVSRGFAQQLGCCLGASLNGGNTLVLTLSGLRA